MFAFKGKTYFGEFFSGKIEVFQRVTPISANIGIAPQGPATLSNKDLTSFDAEGGNVKKCHPPLPG